MAIEQQTMVNHDRVDGRAIRSLPSFIQGLALQYALYAPVFVLAKVTNNLTQVFQHSWINLSMPSRSALQVKSSRPCSREQTVRG